MTVNLIDDLIKDEYGNYYVGVSHKSGGGCQEITLVNYFLNVSFNIFLDTAIEENKKNGHKYPQYRYLGEVPMAWLKKRLAEIESGKSTSKVYTMDEVKNAYNKVEIISLYEKKPEITS